MTRLITRRALMGTALAAGGLAALPRHTTASTPALLEAGLTKIQIAPEGYDATEVWAYSAPLETTATVPGPELRFTQGDRLERRLLNKLPSPTTVHWHGLRLPNAMDGVPGVTQPAVPVGGYFDYAFDLPDAGTYWYHSHVNSYEQVARGLHGPLIIDEPQGNQPDVDADFTLVLDDWRLDTTNAAIQNSFGGLHDAAHAGRLGNLVTANGAFEAELPVNRRNERLRLRVINAATARVFLLGARGLDGWIVARDGMPLEQVEPFNDRTALAPAQRMDVLLDITADLGDDAMIMAFDREGGYAIASTSPKPGTRTRRAPPPPLPPNPLPLLTGLDKAPRHQMTMDGGAMSPMARARHKGVAMERAELVAAGQVWALDGTAGRPKDPFLTANVGETHRITWRNNTRWPHAMHLHGHHFREILKDGRLGPWHDTLLLGPTETREVAFVAEAEGDWLLHCHMLAHAAAGMSSWIRVVG